MYLVLYDTLSDSEFLSSRQNIHKCSEGAARCMPHGGHAAGDRATCEAVSEASLPDQSSALCQTHQEREEGEHTC